MSTTCPECEYLRLERAGIHMTHAGKSQAEADAMAEGQRCAEHQNSKRKFARAMAIEVARQMCEALKPACERLIVAGSLRRRREMVGDVEILYITKLVEVQDGLFDKGMRPAADEVLSALLGRGVLGQRRNISGSIMWGQKNKLAVHLESGIPVDFFAATEANWFNYLVCRTGPKESNTAICMAAQDRGWKWNPYGSGFSRGGALAGPEEEHAVNSEAEVFEFVGLKHVEPWER